MDLSRGQTWSLTPKKATPLLPGGNPEQDRMHSRIKEEEKGAEQKEKSN